MTVNEFKKVLEEFSLYFNKIMGKACQRCVGNIFSRVPKDHVTGLTWRNDGDSCFESATVITRIRKNATFVLIEIFVNWLCLLQWPTVATAWMPAKTSGHQGCDFQSHRNRVAYQEDLAKCLCLKELTVGKCPNQAIEILHDETLLPRWSITKSTGPWLAAGNGWDASCSNWA